MQIVVIKIFLNNKNSSVMTILRKSRIIILILNSILNFPIDKRKQIVLNCVNQEKITCIVLMKYYKIKTYSWALITPQYLIKIFIVIFLITQNIVNFTHSATIYHNTGTRSPANWKLQYGERRCTGKIWRGKPGNPHNSAWNFLWRSMRLLASKTTI